MGMGYAFPPSHRLHESWEYQAIRKMGRKLHTPHFIVYVQRMENEPTRLGLTVSRKVGGAVQRNRTKRVLREFFRLNIQSFPPSVSFSIIAKKGAPDLGLAGVSQELLHLLVTEGKR